MNTDIRIAVSFKGHRKRKKFKMVLGDDAAIEYLLDFWLTVATDKPEGDLSGLDNFDIALMAGWGGDADHFADAMVRVGFLDGAPGNYIVHDWAEHNGYASGASIRSAAARNAAIERWSRRSRKAAGIMPPCDGNAPAMLKQCDGNAPSPTPTPSPNPSPSPTPSPAPENRAPKGNGFPSTHARERAREDADPAGRPGVPPAALGPPEADADPPRGWANITPMARAIARSITVRLDEDREMSQEEIQALADQYAAEAAGEGLDNGDND